MNSISIIKPKKISCFLIPPLIMLIIEPPMTVILRHQVIQRLLRTSLFGIRSWIHT